MVHVVNFRQRESFRDYDTVVLCRAKNRLGKDFYAYVAVETAEKLDALFNAYQISKQIDFSCYGEILAQGLGKEPPAEVVEDMKHYMQ